jgi:hypothetical protein
MSKAGKWRVSVRRDYKQHHLGVFDTAEEGALARDAFLDQHNDQFSIRSGLVSSDPPKRRIRVYARGADNILSKLTASARLEIHSLSAAGWFASSHRQTV